MNTNNNINAKRPVKITKDRFNIRTTITKSRSVRRLLGATIKSSGLYNCRRQGEEETIKNAKIVTTRDSKK